MGRSPCCSKDGLNRGAWTAHEDKILSEYISVHGPGKWKNLPKKAGLKRCGKSCRLRWLNYLRPDIKRGNISADEEDLIIRLHKLLGNRWSLIAGRLPGRTDNEIKNYWNTYLSKKVRDHHTSTSSAQPIEKNTQKTKPKVTPSLSSSPSKLDSHVVHTKAFKCSKLLFVDPLPHSSIQLQSKSKAEPEAEAEAEPLMLVDEAANNNNMKPSMYDNGFLSFPSNEKELSTDLLLDLDIGDICLSDLLNSDFSDLYDFSCNKNNSLELLPCSDQPQMLSEDALKDWTHCSFADEANAEWLGE